MAPPGAGSDTRAPADEFDASTGTAVDPEAVPSPVPERGGVGFVDGRVDVLLQILDDRRGAGQPNRITGNWSVAGVGACGS